jgi:hypothetical protein
MAHYQFDSKFNLGDRVYKNVPGSEEYLITDVSFSAARNQIEYEVMDYMGSKDWHVALELTREKLLQL